MIIYADYNFYINEYGTDIPQEKFQKYAKEASAYIRRLTIGKSDGFEGDELKYATCAVAEAVYNFDKSCINGKIVSSENNDGYSVSYATGNDCHTERLNAEYLAARKWLAGTGLLSRRANRVNKC